MTGVLWVGVWEAAVKGCSDDVSKERGRGREKCDHVSAPHVFRGTAEGEVFIRVTKGV